ncbi:winged helix-turn-helix transcriptional regulator [Lentzea tibetensis]|uniref:Winged helix-turn-helix transcriptional regulator n=1 Tax=Lentzea tibetensis TaxID=2591470 RepID=A0A563EKA8_9PSEU|nr:winged helix-turn-helix domain-containing protein [Lentzea tibetensis]TWP47466.1 winged helix-turn-helix transcriptional regulator [Lentzea tibetensis]
MADGYVSDPKALRALSHPFRWKLIHLLTDRGASTATFCAEQLGESVASCSYHLNMLAKYGFVEEVQGPGRQKPWRLTDRDQGISAEGLDDEGALAAEAAAMAFFDQEFSQIKERMRRRELEPDEWRRSIATNSTTKFLTADELAEMRAEIVEIFTRYGDRAERPEARPEGARPVRFFLSTSVAPEK